ncbi:MAG: PAS domain S-box protein, partial [Candidatus Lokiarchaeota archaeon]|nr:PAS domain S-box protein [Candidatus Lokiarchaeota archaeon]
MASTIKNINKVNQLISENIEDLIFICNENIECEYYNIKELESKTNLIDFLHPEDSKRVVEFVENAFKFGYGKEEFRIIGDNNHSKWYEIKGKRFFDDDNTRKIFLICRDITRIKNMENEINKSQIRYTQLADTLPEIKYWKLLQSKKSITAIQKTREMLEVVINNIPQLIYWKDRKLVYLGCNTNFATINGMVNPHSIISRTDDDLKWVIDKLDYIQECEHNVMRKDESEYNVIELLVTPDGKQAWYEINRIPLHDMGGNVVGILVTYEDISIRKFSEQKLKESEEKNRGLINNITDIIYELDINGKCTYVSNQLFEISGFHPEEMIGHNMFQYLHPEDFSSITEKVKEVFNSGLRVSADFRLRHKDGQYIPVSSNFNVIRINDQERFTGVLRDNTEKKKAELKLRESEEKYRTIFNSSPDYIFITDVEGIILDMNLALLKRIGMTLDEVRGKNFAQFYAGDNLDELLLVRDDIKAGKEIMGSEVKARAKTGEIFEYEVNSVPIKENGKVVKVINLARDVTDKKIAEQKLKESELKYRHLFEKSPYSIILINRKGEIIDCNHATEKIFNNKVEELINRNFLEVVIKSDKNLPLYEQRYRYLLEGVIPEPIEVQIPRSSDGRLIWVSITESLVAIGGETVFQVILQNITEKKIAEQNLKRSQEDLQVLNKELEQKVKERTKDLIDSERQYRTTIDSLGDPLHVVDRDLRIILVNQAFKEWLGDLNIDAEIFGRKIPEVFSFLPPIIYEEYTQVFDTGNTLVTTEITPLPEREITTETRKIPIFHEGKVEQIITIIRDVTERKKAEQKLKEEREKLQNYLDIAGVILLVLNADQTVQLINRKGCEILEEDESEIIGINWIDEYIPENNRELVKKRYNRFINGEIELFENTEAPIITKNGEKRIIAWYNRALKNAEGEIIGSLSSGQDITENKIAEQKLKESEEKFRNMINNLDIGFFRGIYKRELLIYNQAFNRILGLEPHVSMVGADSTQFFADEK